MNEALTWVLLGVQLLFMLALTRWYVVLKRWQATLTAWSDHLELWQATLVAREER